VAADTDLDARNRLLSALAAGANNTDASRISGYSRKHVIQLQKDAQFCAELEERRRELLDGDDGDRKRAAGIGLAVLLEVAQNKDARDADRVSAAKTLVALDAPRAKSKAAEAPAPNGSASTSDPSPEELQKALRVLA